MDEYIRPRYSHSNSLGNNAEKDTAGCRALTRKYIVIGRIIGVGSTESLLKSIAGMVFSAEISQSELPSYETKVCIVSVKGELGERVSVRYVADAPASANSIPVEPRLEDLYLWLFRNNPAEGG